MGHRRSQSLADGKWENVFANRYEANDVEGNVRAMFDLSDGKVDIWIVPGLIPGDVNEQGEIEVKRPKPPTRPRKNKQRSREDKEDIPDKYLKVRHPEISSFYAEVSFELQNKRSPIIRMNIIHPMASDKKQIKTRIYNRTLKDQQEKPAQF